MDFGTLGLLALVLVCPLAMVFMMRGSGHSRANVDADGEPRQDHVVGMSDAQLRELAARADRELKEREARIQGHG